MAFIIEYLDASTNKTTRIGKPVAKLDTAERQVEKRYGHLKDLSAFNQVTIFDDETQRIVRVDFVREN